MMQNTFSCPIETEFDTSNFCMLNITIIFFAVVKFFNACDHRRTQSTKVKKQMLMFDKQENKRFVKI